MGRFGLQKLLLVPLLVVSWSVQAGWVRTEQAIMGTTVRAEVWHDDEAVAQAGVGAVMDEMRRVERLMSPSKADSELHRINAQAADGPVPISRELLMLIQRALAVSRMTRGAFDITFASVGHLYNYRENVKPAEETISQMLPAVDYRHVLLDQISGTIEFAEAGVKIDLGGIAKGYAVDRALEILRNLGIANALVSAGGDTGILGDRLGRPWVVGIRDPRDQGAVVAMLPLHDEALSTSGDYERFFEDGGVRYHHILNPSTGRSVSAVRSVSVVGPDATTTDALATSVFVMGVNKGMTLVDALPGVEAVIVDQSGDLYYSRGLADARSLTEQE